MRKADLHPALDLCHASYLKRGRLQRIAVDGSTPPPLLLQREGAIYASRITPDRRTIVIRKDVSGMNRDILMAPLDSPSASNPLLVSTFDEKRFALSPDGDYASTGFEPLHDVSADGHRFAFAANRDLAAQQMTEVLNWTANWNARQRN